VPIPGLFKQITNPFYPLLNLAEVAFVPAELLAQDPPRMRWGNFSFQPSTYNLKKQIMLWMKRTCEKDTLWGEMGPKEVR